jgi:LmeA-like phospholipid-binding
MSTPYQSPIISRVLSPAMRLWLRAQVEQVKELHVHIEGGDRQILSGHIPRVYVSASNVIYQGLHLSQLQLVGTGIRLNLGQVLKGKPLRLLDKIPIQAELMLLEADLNASLQASLLTNAVTELLEKFLRSNCSLSILELDYRAAHLQDVQILITPGCLTLSIPPLSTNRQAGPLIIRTGLNLVSPYKLCLDYPQQLPHLYAEHGVALPNLQGFTIDLGTDVDLWQLTLEDKHIVCSGRINVIPV